jgi:hypothetical protein
MLPQALNQVNKMLKLTVTIKYVFGMRFNGSYPGGNDADDNDPEGDGVILYWLLSLLLPILILMTVTVMSVTLL